MSDHISKQEKQKAIDEFEKKQKRLFPIGKGIVYTIVGWDIYTLIGMFLISFFLTPGLNWLETDDITYAMEHTVGVGNILVRSATWIRFVSSFFEITGIGDALSAVLWHLPDGVRQSAWDVVNYFLPGFLSCLTSCILVVMDVALLRGITWARIARAFFAVACVIGAVGRLLLFPGSVIWSIVFLVLEFAVCYLLFFSKAVKEYTYTKNQQF